MSKASEWVAEQKRRQEIGYAPQIAFGDWGCNRFYVTDTGYLSVPGCVLDLKEIHRLQKWIAETFDELESE